MLHVATWSWGKKYTTAYLERLMAGVKRNLKQVHSFLVIDERRIRAVDKPLLQGCLIRLEVFDPASQERWGIKPGDRIAVLDLDLIVTGPLDPLFDREDSFTILQGVNTSNPNPYNGSVWMLKAGEHADVWTDFSLDAVRRVPYFAFPDDQAWMRHKIPNAAAFGAVDGVYAFKKNGWPPGDALPGNARIVAFPGHRDPAQFTHLDWVKAHWRV